MQTLLAVLLSLIEPFRFRKHQRERRAQEHLWAIELEELRARNRKDATADGLALANRAVEQEADGLKAERDHQLALAQTFMEGLTEMQEAQRASQQISVDGLMEIAKAISAQAASFGQWIALFQTSGPTSSSVVRDEDEILRDQMKLLEAGMPAELADLPEELRLAWALKNDPNWMDIGPHTV